MRFDDNFYSAMVFPTLCGVMFTYISYTYIQSYNMVCFDVINCPCGEYLKYGDETYPCYYSHIKPCYSIINNTTGAVQKCIWFIDTVINFNQCLETSPEEYIKTGLQYAFAGIISFVITGICIIVEYRS